MRTHISKLMLTVVASVMAACGVDPITITPEEAYVREFIKQFGVFELDRTWNSASRITAHVDPATVNGASEINIYTAMPGTPECFRVASYPAGTLTFDFDSGHDAGNLYVEALDNDGRVVHHGFHKVNNSTLSISSISRSTAGEKCPVTIGEEITEKSADKVGNFAYLSHLGTSSEFWRDTIGIEDDWLTPVSSMSRFYRLEGNHTPDYVGSYPLSAMLPMVGHEKGVFGEQVCNLSRFASLLHPELGVEYVVAEDSEVSLDLFYGATAKTANSFGYMYFKAGRTADETWNNIIRADRYFLIDDASPGKNLMLDGSHYTDGMKLATLVNASESYGEPATQLVTGTRHRLVYFGGDEPSYTFPKDTHIVFFITMQKGTYIPHYSLPAINQKYGLSHSCYHAPGNPSSEVMKNFITYRWGNLLVLAVEDLGGDDDLNDLLFFVNGNLKHTPIIPNVNPNLPIAQSWIIAAEDLGGTFDFDFNDVVFGVSHVAGEETAYVTALASGGALPVYLHSLYPQLSDGVPVTHAESRLIPPGTTDGEFHSWFGSHHGEGDIINAHYWDKPGATVQIKVPADFSVTTEGDPGRPSEGNMGGFWITVEKDGQTNSTITAPSVGADYRAPQMFLVQSSWCWPTEGTKITTVYDGFTAWSSKWWNYPQGYRYIDHGWPHTPR